VLAIYKTEDAQMTGNRFSGKKKTLQAGVREFIKKIDFFIQKK